MENQDKLIQLCRKHLSVGGTYGLDFEQHEVEWAVSQLFGTDPGNFVSIDQYDGEDIINVWMQCEIEREGSSWEDLNITDEMAKVLDEIHHDFHLGPVDDPYPSLQ